MMVQGDQDPTTHTHTHTHTQLTGLVWAGSDPPEVPMCQLVLQHWSGGCGRGSHWYFMKEVH